MWVKMDEKIRIFLSYSSLDYELAKKIKKFLEDFGFEVFLAHTSIEPTKQWEDEIYKNLKTCDVFMPILTKAFKESDWTDQETGIAYNNGKKIVPITIDVNPYGFIGKFQTLRFDTSQFNGDYNTSEMFKIIKALIIHFPNQVRRDFFSSLDSTKTYTYRLATIKFRLLDELEPFSKEEINKIIEESSKNNQIYDATGLDTYIKKWIDKYDKDIEPLLKKRMLEILERE